MKARIRKIQNKLSRIVPPDSELLTDDIIRGYLNPGWGLGTRPKNSEGIEKLEKSGIDWRDLLEILWKRWEELSDDCRQLRDEGGISNPRNDEKENASAASKRIRPVLLPPPPQKRSFSESLKR
jgi:hypothetical protein